MIVLVHLTKRGEEVLGVWLPPVDASSDLRRLYKPRRAGDERYASRVLADKGPAPSWEEWFQQLSERAPYFAWWATFEAEPSIQPAAALARAEALRVA